MQKNLLFLSAFIFPLFFTSIAQNDVLFSVGDTKVKKSEFEYIYKKNNFSNKADYSRKSLEDYLNLYINFRLKVNEAIKQGLDTNDRFKEELGVYEKQLLDSYVDKDILDRLVKQEYERSKTDVNVSHIFFPIVNGNEADALSKANDVLKKIKAGTSFEEAAKSSGDKQTAQKGGKVGWFNSYQLSYPELEEAIYKLKAGEISEPIKSSAGYHIVKLNETRPAYPKIKTAIIKRFFSVTDTTAAGKKLVEDTIRMAYAKLKANEPFENVVQQYSEDDFSKANKGELEWFGINTYAKAFEETAYSLKNGEYSAPFKTNTAWYIVKRLETAKPLSFEEAVPVLKTKLPNLPQYQYEMDKFLKKLSEKFSIKQFPENYPVLKQRLMDFAQNAPFTYRDTSKARVLLQIDKKTYDENDFGKKIQEIFYTIYPKAGTDKYDALIKNVTQSLILDYYKNDIKTNNVEYKALMDEYRNGIMIFALSENNVWNKASEDSTGLLAYYSQHPQDFDLKKRATVRIITTDNQKQAASVYKILQANKSVSDELLAEKLKAAGVTGQKINTQVLDETKTKLNISTESLSLPQLLGNKYQVIQVLNPLPAKKRAFEECRGYVVAAYQEYLEKRWIETLKQKYPVAVNKDVFESLVKK